MSLQNVWHLRTVAETSAKPCMICFKASTAVFITPDNKVLYHPEPPNGGKQEPEFKADFFYICRGHLKDPGFCSPMVDLEAQRKETLEKEKEKIVQEYKEKVAAREKSKKDKEKSKDKDKDKDKDKSQDAEKEAKEDEDSMNEKLKNANEKAGQSDTADADLPRIYSLHRNFYQMRVDRIRKAEIAKRNRERLANPSTFPSVPSGDL